MIIFSRKQFYTGGKSRIPVWQVCGDAVDEHERLVAHLKGFDKGLWWGASPSLSQPWLYRSRRSPVYSVKAQILEDLVRTQDAFEVPEVYFRLVVAILRRDQWRHYTDHKRRDPDGEAEEFFRLKIQWCAGLAGRVENFVADPELYEPGVWCDPEDLIPGLKTINGWVEKFDPRHCSGLNPSEYPDGLDSDAPDSIMEYLALDQMDRREYLTKKPWIIPTLMGRGLEGEIPAEG